MYRLRKAGLQDLPLIYDMQNVPAREKFLMTPLPEIETYIADARVQINAGNEHFYLLEMDSKAEGLIWISSALETCEVWGRHYHSLFYACAKLAFEDLGMQRLLWWIRQSNRRALKACQRFRIRRTKSEYVCTIGDKLEFLAVGEIHYFEFNASEYPERKSLMKKLSIEQGNFF